MSESVFVLGSSTLNLLGELDLGKLLKIHIPHTYMYVPNTYTLFVIAETDESFLFLIHISLIRFCPCL